MLMGTGTLANREYMSIFKNKALPATSYGYHPPLGATAQGWTCTSFECGVTDYEPVRNWAKRCSHCGAAIDPLFDSPWKHEAWGVELQWLIRNHPERGVEILQDQWQVWQFEDAVRRGDRAAALVARANARAYALKRLQNDEYFGPGDIFFYLVWYDLEMDLDLAADDLTFWLSISSSEDVENNNTNRTNCRQVIAMTSKFLTAGGSSHARLSEIKTGCLKIAEDAYPILDR